jgi:hypothetical protein
MDIRINILGSSGQTEPVIRRTLPPARSAPIPYRHPTIDELASRLDVERAGVRKLYAEAKQAKRQAYPHKPPLRPYYQPPSPFKSWAEVNEALVPTDPTDIRADEDLHAYVQARWPTVTSKEHWVVETLMRAHPNISDCSLRIYLGLRRGSVPENEW